MRRAQWSSSGVDLVDIDPGPVPDGWVRLQVTGCGICGSDLHFYRGMRAGVLSPADFASPGHEIAGTILDGGGGLADAVLGITCRYPHQAALAERFGLEAVASASVDDWATEHRPGVVIETVGGEADTMAEAVRCARTGGRVVVVGVFAAPRPTDYVQVLWKELEIVGSKIYGTVASGSEFGAAVRRMGSVSSELAALQTHHFGLDQIMEAFHIADDKSSRSVKVTIG